MCYQRVCELVGVKKMEKDQKQTLDPRVHAFRDDLADERLKGLVDAVRFVPGDEAYVHQDRVPLYATPSFEAELMTEGLFGEGVRIFEISDKWAWGQLMRDEYVGYMPLEALSPGFLKPTHHVSALRSFIYSKPTIKSAPIELVSMMSLLVVDKEVDEFFELKTGGYVVRRHVEPVVARRQDFVEVAQSFLGTPYLWGGRTSLGLDCSALIQVALMACGQVERRDSDLQAASIGALLEVSSDLSQLQRGDLVFWRGHVGVMVDGLTLLHANAHHMQVAMEPLVSAVTRIRENGYGDITAIRRIADYNPNV